MTEHRRPGCPKKGLVGRRIVAVGLATVQNDNTGQRDRCLDWIRLDNGARLILSVSESGCEYNIIATLYPADWKEPT